MIFSPRIFYGTGEMMTALWPYGLQKLMVAVTLIEDYVLTIVVSALSGADQLLSITNSYHAPWFWHFAIGAVLATVTWFLTIRGRGKSAFVSFG